MSRSVAALILAAGKGTRMRSGRPKVLHPLLGRPLVQFPIDLAQELGCDPIVVVVGHGAEDVRRAIAGFPEVRIALQPEQRGTGDAVRCGLEALQGFSGKVLILSGDVPLLRRETIDQLVDADQDFALVTAHAPEPRGYGRILRGRDGLVERIVEDRDASAAQHAVREINAGIYCISAAFLRNHLAELSTNNAQQELYLTDLVAKARPEVTAILAPLDEISGVNDRADLARLTGLLQARVNREHLLAGVTLIDPASTHIDLGVEIAADVVIEPGCVLSGATSIGEGTRIRANSALEAARVGRKCTVGPFARLRPGTVLSDDVHIGNFVETKNAHLAEGAKANHLTYLGDARVGKKTNIGAGTITCNYDGVNKHLTEIGEGVFIGSDTQLVAPVRVGDGAYVAAGTTVVEDVPADSLVLTRAVRVTKEGWAKKRRTRNTTP